MKRIILAIIALALVAVAAFLFWRSQLPPPLATEIVALQSPQDSAGFARASQVIDLKFPADHGAHPDFQTEWWYYTGNLQSDDGRQFGYQLTFFRRGITPGEVEGRTSDWATNQIYFAHFAITDAKNNHHPATERYSRGAAELAGAEPANGDDKPFHVWIDNWSVESLNADGSQVRLRADDKDIALDLTLSSAKPPTLQGDRGLSQKTDAVGNASYYVSFTQMPTQGTLHVNGDTLKVQGASWFDHEWGTTALGANAAGWDWFSIQLDDNRQVMFFQIRDQDGTIEPLSSGTLVEADGSTHHLTREDVSIETSGTWTSPQSHGTYPNKWHIQIPSANLDLTLTPLIADQELRISFTYWEGAVNIQGTSNGKPVQGKGYVEMTGYAPGRGDVGY